MVSWQEDLPLLEPDPYTLVERAELKSRVWQAIQSLPKRERQVILLFHINAYSRAEIAAFLEVSETTVKRHLASARQRLKEGMLQMVQDDLQDQRPSRNGQFVSRVSAFTQQFSSLIDGGQSIVRSLLALAQQQEDPRFQEALAQVRLDVEQGATLSAAMARYPEFFNEPYIQAVEKGEGSDLRAALKHLAHGTD